MTTSAIETLCCRESSTERKTIGEQQRLAEAAWFMLEAILVAATAE